MNVFLISAEKDIMPDALAGLAASAALAVSDIPFNGPISEVRVARINGEFVINPSFCQLKDADLDIIVGATYDNIMMVEGEMKEISEAEMLEAIKFAHTEIKKHCKVQMELMEETGKTVKREYSHEETTKTCKAWKILLRALLCHCPFREDKHARSDAFEALKEEFLQTLPEEDREKALMVSVITTM